MKHLFHLVALAKYYGYNALFNNCITYLFEYIEAKNVIAKNVIG